MKRYVIRFCRRGADVSQRPIRRHMVRLAEPAGRFFCPVFRSILLPDFSARFFRPIFPPGFFVRLSRLILPADILARFFRQLFHPGGAAAGQEGRGVWQNKSRENWVSRLLPSPVLPDYSFTLLKRVVTTTLRRPEGVIVTHFSTRRSPSGTMSSNLSGISRSKS